MNIIERKKTKIYNKIKHLEKLKADLYKNKKLSSYEHQNYRQQYEKLCYNLENKIKKLELYKHPINSKISLGHFCHYTRLHYF